MAILGKSPYDDAAAALGDLFPRLNKSQNLGRPGAEWSKLYVDEAVVGVQLLDNNSWLESENAAGSGVLKLLKADASNNTILNALTGKKLSFEVNEAEIAKVDANGVTGSHFLLTDGSDKNYNKEVYAAGTAYQLTASSAALVFGTTSPSLTIDKAGTYLLFGQVNLKYNGATFAAERTVTLKVRRTNNTAADVSNSSATAVTDIVTTKTFTFATINLPRFCIQLLTWMTLLRCLEMFQ